LQGSQLQTNAFFDLGSPTFPSDYALEGSLGNLYAYQNGNRVLSDAIPALSWVIGSHPVTELDVRFGGPHNFDMMTVENGWPLDRGKAQWPPNTAAAGEWHHSDFRQVAYPFTYRLFTNFVYLGNLK
jgi:hypothetical protein